LVWAGFWAAIFDMPKNTQALVETQPMENREIEVNSKGLSFCVKDVNHVW
jgi:hypothetical protein